MTMKAWTMTQSMTMTTGSTFPQPPGTARDEVFPEVRSPPRKLGQHSSGPKGLKGPPFPPKARARSQKNLPGLKFPLPHPPGTTRLALIVRHCFHPTPRSKSTSYRRIRAHSSAPSNVTAATPLLAARTNGSGTSTSNISISRPGGATSMHAHFPSPRPMAPRAKRSTRIARHPQSRRHRG